jgi:hypothetical protein
MVDAGTLIGARSVVARIVAVRPVVIPSNDSSWKLLKTLTNKSRSVNTRSGCAV